MTGPNGDFAVILNEHEALVLLHHLEGEGLLPDEKEVYRKLDRELQLHKDIRALLKY